MKIKFKKFIIQYINNVLATSHLDYSFTMVEKPSRLPRSVRKSIDQKGFFNYDRNTFFICFKQKNHSSEPVDAKAKILSRFKKNFLNGDPDNTISETEVQEATTGSKDDPKDTDQWFWIVKIQFVF